LNHWFFVAAGKPGLLDLMDQTNLEKFNSIMDQVFAGSKRLIIQGRSFRTVSVFAALIWAVVRSLHGSMQNRKVME
jgi:hypothetical protein